MAKTESNIFFSDIVLELRIIFLKFFTIMKRTFKRFRMTIFLECRLIPE
jgi:hypothetical protein